MCEQGCNVGTGWPCVNRVAVCEQGGRVAVCEQGGSV